tara:strand:+ start:1247 stop:1459 length:213 start_codon:yes stop_codon:yes gene_type:complete
MKPEVLNMKEGIQFQAPLLLSRRYMKNGPPIIESMTPTGMTIGANKVRPRVSANSVRNAPNTAEHGISLR